MNPGSDMFIELRSEDVQEVLSRPPGWLLRWGVTVVFAALGLIFFWAWLIHYPDLIKASFKLTSANAPKAVLARTDGRLVRLFVQEGQGVKSGATLAYLESTARHDDVLRLADQLSKAWTIASKEPSSRGPSSPGPSSPGPSSRGPSSRGPSSRGPSKSGNLEALDRLNLSNYNQLGELQTAYQIFEQAHIQLGAYLSQGFYSQKRMMLQQEIVDLKALADNLREQHTIQAQDIKLAQEDYDIQRRLYDEKVIARLDLKREESKNISRKLPYQQTASALISNLTLQRAKQKEILELDKQVGEERDKFLQALNTLQSAAEAWKTKYVLTAPVSGRVFYTGTLQENQSVAINQEVFYVAPPGTDYYGELQVPQQNSGKVRVGQAVLVKFAGFPYPEFGAVRGRITAIADIPLKDSVFLAKVVLPVGLKTTYGKSLAFKTGMSATADILTDDSRLLEKLFYQLRTVMNGQ